MPITVSCRCGKKYRLKDQLAGKRAKCPACGEILTVPAAEPEEIAPFLDDFSAADLGHVEPAGKLPSTKHKAAKPPKADNRFLIYYGLGGLGLAIVVAILLAIILWPDGDSTGNGAIVNQPTQHAPDDSDEPAEVEPVAKPPAPIELDESKMTLADQTLQYAEYVLTSTHDTAAGEFPEDYTLLVLFHDDSMHLYDGRSEGKKPWVLYHMEGQLEIQHDSMFPFRISDRETDFSLALFKGHTPLSQSGRYLPRVLVGNARLDGQTAQVEVNLARFLAGGGDPRSESDWVSLEQSDSETLSKLIELSKRNIDKADGIPVAGYDDLALENADYIEVTDGKRKMVMQFRDEEVRIFDGNWTGQRNQPIRFTSFRLSRHPGHFDLRMTNRDHYESGVVRFHEMISQGQRTLPDALSGTIPLRKDAQPRFSLARHLKRGGDPKNESDWIKSDTLPAEIARKLADFETRTLPDR